MPSPSSPAAKPQYPSIPEPTNEVASLRATLMALKESVELLTGQRAVRGTTEYSLQGSLEKIESITDNTYSQVYELKQVDEGLASSLQLVQTEVDDVSAEGQMVLRAESNPSGYKAYFGVYLRANTDTTPGTERRAGMHLGLTNANGGVFTLDVDKFVLRDNSSGTVSGVVFNYSGGAFTLTGSVTVNGSLLVNGTVTATKVVDLGITTGKINYNAAGQFYQTSGSGTILGNNSGWVNACSVTITGIDGAYAFVLARCTSLKNDDGLGTTIESPQWRIVRGATVLATDYLVSNGTVPHMIALFSSDAESNYTYTVQVGGHGGGFSSSLYVSITVPEFTVEVRKR